MHVENNSQEQPGTLGCFPHETESLVNGQVSGFIYSTLKHVHLLDSLYLYMTIQ